MKRLRDIFRIGRYRERSILDEWTHFLGQQHCCIHFNILSQGSRFIPYRVDPITHNSVCYNWLYVIPICLLLLSTDPCRPKSPSTENSVVKLLLKVKYHYSIYDCRRGTCRYFYRQSQFTLETMSLREMAPQLNCPLT